LVTIGGEYEYWYDPDFCIYNDVVVIDLDGYVQIFGYPRDILPPTDYHTADLCGDRIIVIGRLGYQDDRTTGTTPVMAVDLRISEFVATSTITLMRSRPDDGTGSRIADGSSTRSATPAVRPTCPLRDSSDPAPRTIPPDAGSTRTTARRTTTNSP